MAEKKPPITCHVLDTTIGKPAANIPVTLTLHNPPSPFPSSTTSAPISTPLTFTSTTNADGRVTSWTPSNPAPFTTAQSLEDIFHTPGYQKYSLTFNTEEYFGAKGVRTFFPEVEVKFVVRDGGKGEHYHVPVLLGPFGYTTYRGS
ncbi:Hydroxyisourate hydrolase [Setomelanomma holmii]|uniref:5-hydroxyisourate hydrolase n=1 Tax=Setomelanomma holmii TaxID=210430 RepID=A0A9P4H298_9PLEO|nr:Hydroxyisourate hydrolase [Setomelanomma holmii]